MAHLTSTSISAAPGRLGGATTRLLGRRPAPRAMVARSAQTIQCMEGAWKTAPVSEVNTMVYEQGFVFVDLRDGWEAEKYGRDLSWTNIPLANMTDEGPRKNPHFLQTIQEMFPDPNTPLIIACDDGELRSGIAAKDLLSINYTNVHVLQGGVDDYLAQYPIAGVGGQQQAAAPPAQAPPAAAPSNTIVITYSTGWPDCFVHFNVDNKGWTDSPGVKMTQQGDVKQFVVEGSRMEFCLNNGGDQWDAPEGNYNIYEAGSYSVSGGNLSKQ